MRYFIYIVIIITNLIYLPNVEAKTPKWQDIDYIIQSFFEVGLGAEHGISKNLNLRKWNKPIRIYVEHNVGDKTLHNRLLNAHIDQLKEITKLDIQRVDNKSAANIFYFFTRQSEIRQLVENKLGADVAKNLHGSVCLASAKINKKNVITSTHIFIPIDLARMHGKLVACIVEEITQSLGLFRDSELVFPSIFNDKTKNTLLTGLDEILLRLLSDKRIKAGMSKTELKPILMSILAEYKSQGLIKTADYRVQKGELYEMLGFRRIKKNN